VVRSKESKLFLAAGADGDLMIPSLVVETDEKKVASRVAKLVDGIVAMRDGVFEGEGDSVLPAVQDTHMPNELVDVHGMLLVRLTFLLILLLYSRGM
jgi:hypothetical protein